jgi:cysteinyl-tRNA synthetase
MELLLAVRTEIRSQKLWGLSDRIRDGLAGAGITLEDSKGGTSWKKAP